MKENTLLVKAGLDHNQLHMVNPPISLGSTIMFENLAELDEIEAQYTGKVEAEPYKLKYGRYGTNTTFHLEKAISKFEEGYATIATSGGASAISTAIMGVIKNGDHVLMNQYSYTPTINLFTKFLKNFGVEMSFFHPSIGTDIEKLIKPNTKVIFMESPSSFTFEIQDFDSIIPIAKKHNLVTILDNTWSSGLYFKPFQHGIDVSVQSLSKYVNGHGDVMMGSITTTKEHYQALYNSFRYTAVTPSPFSCYLAHRGLHSMKVRMDHSAKTTLEVAKFLEQQSEISQVLYPALESNENNHELWKKYYKGAASLFTIVLDKKYDRVALGKMIDGLKYFGIGYSWGGYESLIMPINPIRGDDDKKYENHSMLRIAIGLEDAEDLKEDLVSGLKRLK